MARRTSPSAPTRGPLPSPRGWLGRGGGSAALMQAAPEWRGTTVQVCGLWPFGAGSGTPVTGVPLGRHMYTGATVCADPISWFQRAGLIANPSMFVLGVPGIGKSSTVRRMVLGLDGYGVVPLILGDLKPDYVDLIRAMGGQVIRVGPGRSKVNILDPGEAQRAAARLTGDARREVLADAHARRFDAVLALLNVYRGRPVDSDLQPILERALRVLDDRSVGAPVLGDLLQVLRDAPEEVRAVAVDGGSLRRYGAIVRPLEVDLVGLVSGGTLGDMFSGQTTEPMAMDRPVVFDVSSLDEASQQMQAAALLTCWSYGFGAVNVANVLADAGLEPRRHYFVVMDELWRALRVGQGMVDRVDALTRLNRQRGVGQAMISHTMSDLLALANEEDKMKARGFVERSGMIVCGALPRSEMAMLTGTAAFTEAEQDLLASWQTPPAWGSDQQGEAAPPGRGKFLIKVGGRPGIPITIPLTAAELALHDTNKRWHTRSGVTG